jgi:hypothetical protein
MARQDTRTESNARLLHKALHEAGPMDAAQIMSRLGIDERDFRAAVKYSRTNLDREWVANEIICVTSSHPFLYFQAKKKDQSGQYISHRAKIADGHLLSVEKLLEKELAKFPKYEREIALNLRQIQRMREDIVLLLADA